MPEMLYGRMSKTRAAAAREKERRERERQKEREREIEKNTAFQADYPFRGFLYVSRVKDLFVGQSENKKDWTTTFFVVR
jgi:hypothetical protein